jgi:hypothetical protein
VPGPDSSTDAGTDVSDRCHADFHHMGTSACSSAWPAGEMCLARCTFCQPMRGSGGECVCDGTRWVCPTDTVCSIGGCTGLDTLHSAPVPADCH